MSIHKEVSSHLTIDTVGLETPSGSFDSLHPRKSSKKKPSASPLAVSKNITNSNDKTKRDHHALIKYGSLLLLVGQMVGLVLLMRYTRTHLDSNHELYLASTAVLMMEIAKFNICLAVIFFEKGMSFKKFAAEIYSHVCDSPNNEMMKLCIPSFLYTVQNNLLYLALTNLDAATYQILYQSKILTTAIFSTTMLNKKFSTIQQCSLAVLTVGAAAVQISGSSDGGSHSNDGDEGRNRLMGSVAVLCAACTSGFSGVYFEKILKGSDASLFIRNVQMGLPSMLIALSSVYMQDYNVVVQKGFFVGYSPMVVVVILVQAVGGLIVAVVVKYADNVLKVFASSFSILLSCLISAVAFDFRPNFLFLVGTFLVCLSTAMYAMPNNKKNNLLPLANGGVRR